MDDGRGRFQPVSEGRAKELDLLQKLDSTNPSVFRKGEILKIKNSRFKVVTLGGQYMKLKLSPKVKSE